MINEAAFINIFEDGQQTKTILIQLQQQKYVLQFMKNDKSSMRRINIQEKIKGVPQTIQQCGYIVIDNLDMSQLQPKDSSKFQFINSKRLVSVTQYYDLPCISLYSFIGTGRQNQLYMNSNQLNQALSLFQKILVTIKTLHNLNIFHFDIKPENILADDNNFVIIDFGSAMTIDEQNAINLLIENVQIAQIYQITELFSPTKYDQCNGWIVANKFDSYSLGCVLYYILTDDYLPYPMEQYTNQFKNIVSVYGIIVADLIQGLTSKTLLLRYSIEQAIIHPAFNQFMFVPQRTSIHSIYHYIENKINSNYQKTNNSMLLKYLISQQSQFQNHIDKCMKNRSKSVSKYNIKKRSSFIWDDQHNMTIQNAINHDYLYQLNNCFSKYAVEDQLS
ncbi:Kinase [Hexamita inflata]|uniref:Kinase n=1 Tax=Hexamita inflata TaxID=28002 RepID=A0ABP1MD15_9EUKA